MRKARRLDATETDRDAVGRVPDDPWRYDGAGYSDQCAGAGHRDERERLHTVVPDEDCRRIVSDQAFNSRRR